MYSEAAIDLAEVVMLKLVGGNSELPAKQDGPAELSGLAARCLGGDPAAWDDLVRRFTPLIWTVARSFGLNSADCEDVCQLTWLRLTENIASIRRFDRVSAWIVTAAKREALRHLMRNGRYLPVGDDHPFDKSAESATPEEHALAGADVAEALAAFRDLPEKHQALLGLLLADPAPSYDEISELLDIPRGSIGPTRQRILRRLRDQLKAA